MNSKRREQRYTGISLSVLYSPVINGNIPELAESYFHVTSHDMSISGMSFDVNEPLSVNSELVLLIPGEQGATDTISAVVRWCNKLNNDHYRVGVVIDVDAGIKRMDSEPEYESVLYGPGIPIEASLVCPACLVLTNFTYKAMQLCGENDELPLYDCGACGTTRSITSLLRFNRRRHISDDL